MARIVFIDTETTGLNPVDHAVWEVAAIVREDTADSTHDTEHVFQLQLTERDMALADPKALELNHFHERRQDTGLWSLERFGEVFAYLTRDSHLVGMNVSFDAERLRMILEGHGAEPTWHYHLIDVEAMILGFQSAGGNPPQYPFSGTGLVRSLGISPERYLAHTALGDARLVRDAYDHLVESPMRVGRL